MNSVYPVIAIVGRANVGKSTIFNVLSNTRNALVANIPGLTRDRQYSSCSHKSKQYILIDTAGIESDSAYEDSEKLLYAKISSQVELAIEEADYILFVVDTKAGITAQDQVIADKLRMSHSKVFLVANKAENNMSLATNDFFELGFSSIFAVSAAHRKGLVKLMDNVLSNYSTIDRSTTENDEKIAIRFAIVGKPNVGKSTLVNALLRQDRMITSDLAGTTRDSVSAEFVFNDNLFTIVDTAGIRKRSKVYEVIEKFSILKVLKTISLCDVVAVLLDATIGVNSQDISVINHAIKAAKPIVIVVNKIDLLTEVEKNQLKITLKEKLHFVPSAKFTYISAIKKSGLTQVFWAVLKMYQSLNIKLATPKLTRIMQEAIRRQPIPTTNGRLKPKLKYAHQGGNNPLTIVIHGNRTSLVPVSYVKYLTNVFREVCHVDSFIKLEFRDNFNPYAS